MSYHLGLPLCNSPQGQNGFNVNSVGKIVGTAAKARQKLHKWLQATRMSCIAQDFNSTDELIVVASFKSTDDKFVDGLCVKEVVSSEINRFQ